jgi:DNA processing protein
MDRGQVPATSWCPAVRLRARSVGKESRAQAVEILHRAGIEHFGVRVHGEGEYPEALRTAEHPVEFLYFIGWWDLVSSRSVAVVGTREPSAQGEARARSLTKKLIADDFTVVSGLARGIDTVVHTTALAEGGRTIAVLGTPLAVRYPKENSDLQDRLGEKQLVISQVPVIRYGAVSNPTTNATTSVNTPPAPAIRSVGRTI